ncbi:MAG: acetyl-CoA hydrolase/transferase C-terminal domain-containing protein [Fimbriimonadales bacterium]
MHTYVSAAEAVALIPSHSRVFLHSVAAAPHELINAMVARAPELRDVEIVSIHTEGGAPYTAPEYAESFRLNSLFVGPNVRKAVNSGLADFTPVFLSEVPLLFRRGLLPLDVAMVQVSPPDRHGYCSLGVSVDTSLAAVQTARIVIAQVNPNMPRTHGDGHVHHKAFSAMTWCEDPLPEHASAAPTEVERRIGEHVASLVEDGATLQMGIGAIPNAVLASLTNHRRIGIHTEMFAEGVIDLVEKGVITGEEKRHHRGKIVAGFVMGSRRLYDFVDDNPNVAMLDIAYVNDTTVIRKQPKMTSINSAIEVDLTGQVVADSIGTYQFSGIGGQMDFVRGSALSPGGKPIIALPSTTSKGESRIVGFLHPGAGVVTTRGHVHYVATEWGVIDLYAKNLADRAKALITIAHPDHREALEKAAFERFGS